MSKKPSSLPIYTNLGCHIWQWDPWVKLPTLESKLLWLALYTSPEAKQCLPGLFIGTIAVMAQAANLALDTTAAALDTLIEHDLVEYDAKHRVLRMTQLPDGCEAPDNPSHLSGMFRRFRLAPACPIRDAYVDTMRWLLCERAKPEPPSQGMEEVWSKTFGTITPPARRRRGVQRVMDASTDTSTPSQPSLFDRPDTVSERTDAGSGSSPASGSGIFSPPKEINNLLSDRTPSPHRVDTVGTGSGTGTVDREDSLLFQEEGSPPPVEISSPPPVRPELTTPWSPDTLVTALGPSYRGVRQDVPPDARDGLQRAIADLVATGATPADLALVAQLIRVQSEPMAMDSTPPAPERIARWAALPGRLVTAVQDAKEDHRIAEAKSAHWKRQLEAMGVT